MYEEDQLPLLDGRQYVIPTPLAAEGSQRWLQIAVEYAPELLLEALKPTLGLEDDVGILWKSPRACRGWSEFRDQEALRVLGSPHLPHRRMCHFWPPGGPVWDALARTSDGQYIFLEAKAHLRELVSPGTDAYPPSRRMIDASLREARGYFAANPRANWSGPYYQFANRLAFHYLFHGVNHLPSHMVFLYFLNDTDSGGPKTISQWKPGLEKLHATLGLPHGFSAAGVHSIFLDVGPLKRALCAHHSKLGGIELDQAAGRKSELRNSRVTRIW